MSAPEPEPAYAVGQTGTYHHGMLDTDISCEIVRVSKRAIEIALTIDGRAVRRVLTRTAARAFLRVS